ncbi:hypothetical protein IFVP22_C1320037 [Vibrio parahaemolyticus]
MVPVWFRLVTRLDIINKKALSILQGLFYLQTPTVNSPSQPV